MAIVYVVAGAKFGSGLGLLLVTAATAIHLAGSYWIAKSFLRSHIERILAKRHHHLPVVPGEEQASVVLVAALVPGLPYAVRNYLLGLTEIPFRTVFWICLPVYVIRSWVAILFGESSGDLTYETGVLLGLFYCVKAGISAYLIKRLYDKHHHKDVAARSTIPSASRLEKPAL